MFARHSCHESNIFNHSIINKTCPSSVSLEVYFFEKGPEISNKIIGWICRFGGISIYNNQPHHQLHAHPSLPPLIARSSLSIRHTDSARSLTLILFIIIDKFQWNSQQCSRTSSSITRPYGQRSWLRSSLTSTAINTPTRSGNVKRNEAKNTDANHTELQLRRT